VAGVKRDWTHAKTNEGNQPSKDDVVVALARLARPARHRMSIVDGISGHVHSSPSALGAEVRQGREEENISAHNINIQTIQAKEGLEELLLPPPSPSSP